MNPTDKYISAPKSYDLGKDPETYRNKVANVGKALTSVITTCGSVVGRLTGVTDLATGMQLRRVGDLKAGNSKIRDGLLKMVVVASHVAVIRFLNQIDGKDDIEEYYKNTSHCFESDFKPEAFSGSETCPALKPFIYTKGNFLDKKICKYFDTEYSEPECVSFAHTWESYKRLADFYDRYDVTILKGMFFLTAVMVNGLVIDADAPINQKANSVNQEKKPANSST